MPKKVDRKHTKPLDTKFDYEGLTYEVTFYCITESISGEVEEVCLLECYDACGDLIEQSMLSQEQHGKPCTFELWQAVSDKKSLIDSWHFMHKLATL